MQNILPRYMVTIATLIYYPFFKMYERQLLQQEQPSAAAQPVKE
ncbi:hypothetical protein [Pantoea stewartii]|uniref:Uncharacterized protein n=1 Tax=Pantoea stewartii subsp. stewartii DC283 TaxID=660596 RepID=H3R9U0_PANSE|nr:hypothetical protein [Pantoea stewartii]EHU01953.1 hypothetical protein CKS_0422 [Pantoea stewartii subsp. stewartii DC283]